MLYTKPHITYKEQLELLIKRGLEITDKEHAKHALKQISYYRFSAYGLPFQKEKDFYNDGITFENIESLYYFDHELRKLIFDVLEYIEIALRTRITYTFAELHGPFGYTDPFLFSRSFNHSDWFTKINAEIHRARETFITHYHQKYSLSPNLPLWMATEVFSFGSLSKMYSGMKRHEKRAISLQFNLDDNILGNWLHVLVYLRNICAHHARLWNRTLAIKPSFPEDTEWKLLQTKIRHDKIFATLTVCCYLLQKVDSPCMIKSRIKDLLQQYPIVNSTYMGFPEDWETTIWW